MEEASCVHGVADDSYAEDCHGEGIAAVERVAAKQLGDGLVVVLWTICRNVSIMSFLLSSSSVSSRLLPFLSSCI